MLKVFWILTGCVLLVWAQLPTENPSSFDSFTHPNCTHACFKLIFERMTVVEQELRKEIQDLKTQMNKHPAIVGSGIPAFSVCSNDSECMNGGQCSDGICECPAGVSGLNCEVDQDECKMEEGAQLCGEGSSCYNTHGSYECRCNNQGQAYKDGSCGEAAELTKIIILKPGTATGNVTITLEDDKGDNCVVTADVSSAVIEIHGPMDSAQGTAAAKYSMDRQLWSQTTLQAGENIEYYIDDSFVSIVQYLTFRTSSKGIQVKVCKDLTTTYKQNSEDIWEPHSNCTNCEASTLIWSDGKTSWKQAKCNMDGDSVRLDASETIYLQEVEVIATSKIRLELLGAKSASSSSKNSKSPVWDTLYRIYDGRLRLDGRNYCFQNENGDEIEPWVKYVLKGTAIVHFVKFLNRIDCCPELLADTEVWVCDGGNCEKCGQTPASTSFDETVTVKAFETVTCSKPLKGDTLQVRKSEGSIQFCGLDIYGECESNNCQRVPFWIVPESYASGKSITSVSDVFCTNILAADGTTLKSATVRFDGKSTDAEWSFNETTFKFNGVDYKVTDNLETTFSDAKPSKLYNF